MSDPRLAAVAHLQAVLDGRSLDSVLEAATPTADERDRALAAELSYGVCRWYRRLDRLVGELLAKPLKRKDRDLHLLLLVGAYQLLYSRIPPHAAVATAVDASRGLGKPWASRLINGVLRRLQRERSVLAPRVDADPAVRFALPDWLYRRLQAAWPTACPRMLPALQARPPMTLRVDLGRISRADYLGRLTEAGLGATVHDGVPGALVLDTPVAVQRLPGFGQGLVSVQDAGAQLAATFLDLRPGQRVLDACAAPGGKTLAMLQHAAGLEMVALDIDEGRLGRVADNLHRAGCKAQLLCADAVQTDGAAWAQQSYDRILVDAPCSATGVLRRHPDIRLLRRERDIVPLVARQAAMLDALWPLLRPGGRLLYATCSLLPAENAEQVSHFLARRRARVVELPTGPGIKDGQGVQLLPGLDDTDGFYYAALEKPATDST